MAYRYINRTVPGLYVEYAYELTFEDGNEIGHTYQDYLNDKWILMSEEQKKFKEENISASVQEVIDMKLKEITPEEKLSIAKSNKIAELSSYRYSSDIKTIIFENNHMWIEDGERLIIKDRCNTAETMGEESVVIGSTSMSPMAGVVLVNKIQEYDEAQEEIFKENIEKINNAISEEEVSLINVKSGWLKTIELDNKSLQKFVDQYQSKSASTQVVSFVKQVINNFPMTANEALEKKVLFPSWGDKNAPMGKAVEVGFRFNYKPEGDKESTMYEVISSHTLSSEWVPGVGTASLYKVVQMEHTGTIEDPIPWVSGMELFKDKYYTEDDLLYKCIRDSEIAMSFRLSDLITGGYVELVP